MLRGHPPRWTPYDWNNKKSITSPFIRKIEHAHKIHTVTGDPYNNTNKTQPPGLTMHREYQKQGTAGKIGNNATVKSQHVTDTPSQKYENYIREYTLHRNKCIAIIRDAFQDIRAMLNDRENQRNNTTFSRTSKHNAYSEIDQSSAPTHRETHDNRTDHNLTIADTICPHAHAFTARGGTTDVTTGPEHRNISLNDTTQYSYPHELNQTSVHDNTTVKHVHNNVGENHATRQTHNNVITLNRDGNRLSQSQLRPARSKNLETCTHTIKVHITNRPSQTRGIPIHKNHTPHNLRNTLPMRHTVSNVQIRGKNSHTHMTTIHRHTSEIYDPTTRAAPQGNTGPTPG